MVHPLKSRDVVPKNVPGVGWGGVRWVMKSRGVVSKNVPGMGWVMVEWGLVG